MGRYPQGRLLRSRAGSRASRRELACTPDYRQRGSRLCWVFRHTQARTDSLQPRMPRGADWQARSTASIVRWALVWMARSSSACDSLPYSRPAVRQRPRNSSYNWNSTSQAGIVSSGCWKQEAARIDSPGLIGLPCTPLAIETAAILAGGTEQSQYVLHRDAVVKRVIGGHDVAASWGSDVDGLPRLGSYLLRCPIG